MSLPTRSALRRLLVLIGLLLSCANCAAPSISNSTSSFAQPTAPVTPSATILSPSAVAAESDAQRPWTAWSVVLDESFHDNRRRWLAGKSEGDLFKADLSVGPDIYRIDAHAKKQGIYASVNRVPVNMQSGFYLAVDASKVRGQDDASYGLVFLYKQLPDKDRDHYYFELRDHDFRFALRSNRQWHILIDWTHSPLIHPNQVNKIAVFAQGSKFIFFINDTYVDDIEDKELKQGDLGVAVALFHDGDAETVEFDNLEVRTP